ncbi:MAG: amidophosphoribosyltransferase [Flavobacteriales bacterium]|nr:MAG: amidophosphoribosyltransferase [Flavobacteriales bacterium]
MFNDFFNLIFPKLCCACNTTLLKNEKVICVNCVLTLPKTNFHLDKENPVNKVFWGRVQVEMATSFYLFSKKSRVQHLLHQLKYKGGKYVGAVVGELLGNDLKKAKYFKGIDFVIPVPLHKNKLKKRGYNQSEWIAKGVAEAMNISINTTTLFRKEDSQTQTRKSRYKRWENVGEIFGIATNELEGKKVLLIDDVVTTGATIEACAQVLIKQNCKVYVATIAYA